MREKQTEHVEHENLDRWLISYADFITLLFAFFVVMYAISSVNVSKYEVLSTTLDAAFKHQGKSIDDVSFGELEALKSELTVTKDIEIREQRIQQILESLEKSVAEVDEIRVERFQDELQLAITNDILFASGSAALVDEAIPVLNDVAQILQASQNAIKVEGFTDNIPIATAHFPSNWELSAARAAAVVRALSDAGVSPKRLAAVGYGEFAPIASNSTAEGRKANRRVLIRVLATDELRPEAPAEDTGEVSSLDAVTAASSDTDANTTTSRGLSTGPTNADEPTDTGQLILIPLEGGGSKFIYQPAE